MRAQRGTGIIRRPGVKSQVVERTMPLGSPEWASFPFARIDIETPRGTARVRHRANVTGGSRANRFGGRPGESRPEGAHGFCAGTFTQGYAALTLGDGICPPLGSAACGRCKYLRAAAPAGVPWE